MSTVLVTGSAGFIGAAFSQRLLDLGHSVVGVDNFNTYYDVGLKEARNELLSKHRNFEIRRGDIKDFGFVASVFSEIKPEFVVHLAAQAGVRYSMENPAVYLDSNINGFLSILECCRKYPVKHLVFASSS